MTNLEGFNQTSPETWLKSNQITRPEVSVNAVMVQIIEAPGQDGERLFQRAVSILCKDEHMLPALQEEARKILRG
jgi:hypothetical protein